MFRISSCLALACLFLPGAIRGQLPGGDCYATHSLRIVVIGSSTAFGTGAQPPDSAWVNRYRSWLKSLHSQNQVVNLARGGYQTYHLMPGDFKAPAGRPAPDTLRNITKALSLQPDAILLNLPSNDAAAGYGTAEQLANFDAIVFEAWRAGVPVWVCSTQPRRLPPERVLTQLQVRDSIFHRYGALTVDYWESLAQSGGSPLPALDAGDGIHLNNAGHRLLFERILALDIPSKIPDTRAIQLTMDSVWASIVPVRNHLFGAAILPKWLPGAVQEAILLDAGHPASGVDMEEYDFFGRLLQRRTGDLPRLIRSEKGLLGSHFYPNDIRGPVMRWAH